MGILIIDAFITFLFTVALTLSQIYIYPIKSLGGISLQTAFVQARGLQYDRRWMLVDENNQFLTQRTFAEMALLQVELEADGLRVRHKIKNLEPLLLPLAPLTSQPIQVSIWDDVCTAVEVSATANAWFSEALNRPCRLVFMPETSRRPVDPAYAHRDEIVSFADAYPILVIGEASLQDLNKRLADPVPMDRFRPSLVFTGGQPYEEETWNFSNIQNNNFQGVKPCSRCVLTTIDQNTAEKSQEPLRTLAEYRRVGHKVLFGQNVLPLSPGSAVSVGDTIQVENFRT